MEWTTKDGRVLNVCDMSDDHIKNTISMLRRKGFVSPSEVDLFLSGPVPNGDMAQMAWEQEMNEVFGKPVAPVLDVFEEELKLRGK